MSIGWTIFWCVVAYLWGHDNGRDGERRRQQQMEDEPWA